MLNSVSIGIDIIKPNFPSSRIKNAIGKHTRNSFKKEHSRFHILPTMSSTTESEAVVIPSRDSILKFYVEPDCKCTQTFNFRRLFT